MDHERARADFMEHRDGDLPEEERRALEEHLAGCGDCRREWEAYCRTVDGVSGLRVIAPPADLGSILPPERPRNRTAMSG